MATPTFRDRTAIVGVGYTPMSKNSGVSELTLALDAITAALDDAGLTVADVDGIATHRGNDSVPPWQVAPALGVQDWSWWLDQFGGGSTSHLIVGQAAMAVASGMADCVVCYRAINARSEFRMGRAPAPFLDTQYQAPYGLTAPAQHFAMLTREHMVRYGTTDEQLGSIAVNQRAWAVDNDRAMQRTPITIGDYLASRWIVEPLRLLDCCLETDAAVAIVVTTAERAQDLRQPPVRISAFATGPGLASFALPGDDQLVSGAARVAPRLFGMAEIGPGDVDVAELYDCFTFSVLVQLEDYGFCAKGEGGPFCDSGATARGGSLPVNTHGGFLSEGYVHGLNHVAEAVSQLRGQAGPRQVPGAEVALSTAQPGYIMAATSALVLTS